MNELKIIIHYLKRKVQEHVYVQNCNVYKEKRIECDMEKIIKIAIVITIIMLTTAHIMSNEVISQNAERIEI